METPVHSRAAEAEIDSLDWTKVQFSKTESQCNACSKGGNEK